MNKRMIAALTTGVVAVSTALQAMPVHAADYDSYKYVMMNLPYSVSNNPGRIVEEAKHLDDFLYVSNTSAYDAVTTATPKAMDEDMFPETYYEREGVISGVTIPVKIWGRDGAYYLDSFCNYPVTGQQRDDAEDLIDGGDYDYYELSGVPQSYIMLYEPGWGQGYSSGPYRNWFGTPSGDLESLFRYNKEMSLFGYQSGDTSACTGDISVSIEDGLDSEYKDVTIHVDADSDDLGTVYGVVLVAAECENRSRSLFDREYYALRHLEEIWTDTEYGFDLDGDLAALGGKDLEDIYIYSSTGLHNVEFGYYGPRCGALHIRKKTPAFEISTSEGSLKHWSDSVSGKVGIELNGLPDDIGWRDNAKSTVYYLDEQGNKVVIAETGDSNNNEGGGVTNVYVSTDKIQNGQTYYVDFESDYYASATSSNGLRFYNPMLDDEDDQKQEESGGTDQGSTGGETFGDSGSGSTDTGKTEDGGSGSGSDIDTGKSDVNTDDVAGKTDSEDATANDDADNAGGSDEEETPHKSRNNGEDRHGTKYLSWVTVSAGTATTDGYMEYRCSECGRVKYRVPISAYYNFNKESESSIQNAAQGATVKVDTKLFVSFHKSIVDELKARPDVTLVVDYTYQGVDYEMTIPAGSGALMEQLFGQDQFAGFRYLAGAFATVER